MNNNSTLKTVLTAVFLFAVYLYTHKSGTSVVVAPTNNEQATPTIIVPPSDTNIHVQDHSSTQEERTSPDAPPVSKSTSAPERPTPVPPPVARHSDNVQPSPQAHTSSTDAPKRDLEQDERNHGHTLSRHVARTDQQLIDRMKAESISSASTYTDKETAERTCALALIQNKAKIDAWIAEGANRDKFAFDYRGDGRTQIGRSIHRGSTQSVPCYDAKVVLIPRGNSFTVLTTYPEGR